LSGPRQVREGGTPKEATMLQTRRMGGLSGLALASPQYMLRLSSAFSEESEG